MYGSRFRGLGVVGCGFRVFKLISWVVSSSPVSLLDRRCRSSGLCPPYLWQRPQEMSV